MAWLNASKVICKLEKVKTEERKVSLNNKEAFRALLLIYLFSLARARLVLHLFIHLSIQHL